MWEVLEHSPHLIIWSEGPGSGKSNLRKFIERLVPANVLSVDRVTGQRAEKHVLRETAKRNDPFWIEFYQKHGLVGLGLKTYLFDEADQYTYSNLVTVLLNAAHAKHGKFLTADGSVQEVFAPVALFRIGDP